MKWIEYWHDTLHPDVALTDGKAKWTSDSKLRDLKYKKHIKDTTEIIQTLLVLLYLYKNTA